MNIYEFAMKMEMDGEAYYRELASRTKIPALQKILGMLADDEVGHYKIVKNMRDNLPAETYGDLCFNKREKCICPIKRPTKPIRSHWL